MPRRSLRNITPLQSGAVPSLSLAVRRTDARADIKDCHGTSNVTVADSDGLVISITTTVGLSFGSRIITRHGIVLNDSMDDFSVEGKPNWMGYEPSPANYSASYDLDRVTIINLTYQSLAGNARSARAVRLSSRTKTIDQSWPAERPAGAPSSLPMPSSLATSSTMECQPVRSCPAPGLSH